MEEVFLIMLVQDPCKEPSMVVDLPMLDLPGVSGVQDNPPKAKAGKGRLEGIKRGGRMGTDRKSRPPPALSALIKMAAVLSPGVSTEKSQTDLLVLTQKENGRGRHG